MINKVYIILLILVFLSAKSGHYSTINFFLLWYIRLFKQYNLYPFIICNTIGTIATWYSAVLLDYTIPYRMMQKNNWSCGKFIMGDIMLHIVPLLQIGKMLYKFEYLHSHMNLNNSNKPYEIVKHCGFYSLFANMLWSLIYQRGFELNDRYVPLPTYKWNIVWGCNVISHLIPMIYMNSFTLFNSNPSSPPSSLIGSSTTNKF